MRSHPEARQDVKVKTAPDDEPSLKGTFASVMLLGAFLAVVWLGVFLLFIARN